MPAPLTWLARRLGYTPARPGRPAPVAARYDAAQTDDTNRRHWLGADGLSAAAANSPEVRRVLRNRARHERANNPYVDGLVRTKALDLIGAGPRVQLTGPAGSAPGPLRTVAREFARWADAVALADELTTGDEAKTTDGEVFLVAIDNPAVDHPVKVGVRAVECDRVREPGYAPGPDGGDGIEFDAAGNPVAYKLLKTHPADPLHRPDQFDRLPAAAVFHWFRAARPGQVRGVSELASMLSLTAYQRRYLMAVVAAAEAGATIAGVMETDLPPPEDVGRAAEFDRLEYERAAFLTVPHGWKAHAFKSEQPTSTAKEFNGELLNGMGRGVLAPFNVIAGNSSGYNFSSGRLDHIPYHRSHWVERDRLRRRFLGRLFRHWFLEAAEVGLVPAGCPPLADLAVDWQWDGFAAIDPGKDAAAAAERIAAGLSTLSEECAAEGKDWRATLEQQAVERAERVRLGLPDPAAPPPTANGSPEQTADEEAARAA